MLIEVFEAEKSRVRWYYFIAYGIPLFITFISAAIYPQGYGTERHCWLQTDNYFIYSFVGPVIVIISVSINKFIYNGISNTFFDWFYLVPQKMSEIAIK